jgi:release factor glutamine methyltransferase
MNDENGEHLDAALLEQLRASLQSQPDKPEETPESTLRALHFAAAGVPLSVRGALKTPLPALDSPAKVKLAALVKRRVAGIPLAHITKRQQFMGIEMLAGPEALIPRAETELLGYETLAAIRSLAPQRGPLTIVDVCTGSGNVVLGAMVHEPAHKGYGSDISHEAIELARKNAEHLGLDERVEFRHGDLLGPFRSEELLGKVDVMSCNPPYISSKKVKALHQEISGHEPIAAFDGGPFGVTIIARLIREAIDFLKSDSFLCLEVGEGQGPFVESLFHKSKMYRHVRPFTDDARRVRGFTART